MWAAAAAGVLAAGVLLAGTGCTPQPIETLPSVSETTAGTPLVVDAMAPPDNAGAQESAVVANIYAAALNAAGIKAAVGSVGLGAGGALQAVEHGQADVVAGYAGSLLISRQPAATARKPADVLAALKTALPEGVELAAASAAQDNDSIAVTKVTAQKYTLKTLDDLAKVCGKLTVGASSSFASRAAGKQALTTEYKCRPKSYAFFPNTADNLVLALLRDQVQAADISSSSPAITDNDLVVLTDTRSVFPANPVVPLVAPRTVPDAVQQVLDKVSGQLTSDDLVKLNRLVGSGHHASPPEVAVGWLRDKGLVKAP